MISTDQWPDIARGKPRHAAIGFRAGLILSSWDTVEAAIEFGTSPDTVTALERKMARLQIDDKMSRPRRSHLSYVHGGPLADFPYVHGGPLGHVWSLRQAFCIYKRLTFKDKV